MVRSVPPVPKLHNPAIIVHFDLWNKKRGLTLKVHAFLICTTIQDIRVMVSVMKPVVYSNISVRLVLLDTKHHY
jgi:hypothetical protein